MNIATGVVMPFDVTDKLVRAVELGRSHMKTFVEERLNTHTKSFWDPIPQVSLKTFATVAQKKQIKTKNEKAQIVNADRQLFG